MMHNNMTRNNQNNAPQNVTGFFIYKNKHNQNVYYDIIKKKGYIIYKDDEKKYTLYSSRLVMSFVLFVFLYWFFNLDLKLSIIVSLIALAVFEGMFRFRFLPSLIEDTTFKKEKREGLILSIAKTTGKNKLIVVTILGLVMIALGIVNILFYDYEGTKLLGQYVFIVIGVGFSLIYFLAYLKKTKENL